MGHEKRKITEDAMMITWIMEGVDFEREEDKH